MWSCWSPDSDPVVCLTTYPTDGLHGGCSPELLTDNSRVTETPRFVQFVSECATKIANECAILRRLLGTPQRSGGCRPWSCTLCDKHCWLRREPPCLHLASSNHDLTSPDGKRHGRRTASFLPHGHTLGPVCRQVGKMRCRSNALVLPRHSWKHAG